MIRLVIIGNGQKFEVLAIFTNKKEYKNVIVLLCLLLSSDNSTMLTILGKRTQS